MVTEAEDKMDEGRSQITKSQFVFRRKSRAQNSCTRYFQRFDDVIMRPIFIYNYEADMIRRKDEFMELFQKDGQKWEQLYLSEHP